MFQRKCIWGTGAQVLVVGGNKTSNEYLSLLSRSLQPLLLPSSSFSSSLLSQAVQPHTEEADCFEGAGPGTQLCGHRCQDSGMTKRACVSIMCFFFVHPHKPFTPGTVETGCCCQGDSLSSGNGGASGVGAEVMHDGIC